MTEESLDARLRAVERAVTDGDVSVADLSEAADVHERLDELEQELADVTARIDALDATVQSLHGYVGEIEHVNERVERRADAARAAVERLEDAHQSGHRTGVGERETSRSETAGGGRAPTTRGRAGEESSSAEAPATGTQAVANDEGDESLLDRVRDSL